MPKVTIVPEDKIVLVDRVPLQLDESVFVNADFHAVQWNGDEADGEGEIEYGGKNVKIGPDDYAGFVSPYVAAWRDAKGAQEKAQQAQEEFYNTPEQVQYRAITAATTQANQILMTKMAAPMLQTADFSAEEYTVFATAELFPKWAADTDYTANQRIQHNGIVYKVVQDVHSLEHQAPDAEGMLAIYQPLNSAAGGEHAGTQEAPVPFIYGMSVSEGKYYSYEEKIYLCKAEMSPCVWYPGTAGMWQWELVE